MGESSPECIAGIVYFSSVPDGMNVTLLTNILKPFGELGKVYLVPSKVQRSKKNRSYDEGWVEFKDAKVAKCVAKQINCTEVPGGKRRRWYGQLWNVRFLPNTTWTELFAVERAEEQQRRLDRDRDILVAKREARQFKAGLDAADTEDRWRRRKGPKFEERITRLDLASRQRLTEAERKARLTLSHRTPPTGSVNSASAVTNSQFMASLFTGGL